LIGLVLFRIFIVSLWKVFEKAGRKGWIAIIPFYNIWVLFEISGKPGWWSIPVFIGAVNVNSSNHSSAVSNIGTITSIFSLIGFVLIIIASLELAKRFKKSNVFAIFGIAIFSIIGIPILGLGKSKYKA
jgi:hypothetical protein